MARLSRKHKNTIISVINKWRDAYAGIRPVNYDRIRELIAVAYKDKTRQVRTKTKRNRRRGWSSWKKVKLGTPYIHFVRSPVAFMIAQAVIRGRLGKKNAEEVCGYYGIDKSFVANLRRESMTHSFGQHSWHRGSSCVGDVWKVALEEHAEAAKSAAFSERPTEDNSGVNWKSQIRDYDRFAPFFPDMPGLSRNKQIRASQNNDLNLTNSLHKAIGRESVTVMGNFNCSNPAAKSIQDLLNTPWSSGARAAKLERCDLADPTTRWNTDYMDAEIICELMGLKDISKTWAYELMREAHVVMCFTGQVLVLAERPTVHVNASGELHNDEGPALHWADGAKQYYIDGHALGTLGELIVEKPEQLTIEHINNEENEEVKRLAIEQYGWGRYLEGVGARVIDRRNNAVDNTIEALVSVRHKFWRRTWGWRSTPEETTIEQRKLILSCRSTARQYFLAVPEDVHTCEAGQHWMAEGSNTQHVAALSRPVRVIGAS